MASISLTSNVVKGHWRYVCTGFPTVLTVGDTSCRLSPTLGSELSHLSHGAMPPLAQQPMGTTPPELLLRMRMSYTMPSAAGLML
jgi:hypothetical protein